MPLNYVATTRTVWPVAQKWHDNVAEYQLVNSYGLFRKMTGVEGRPEVIIEGKMHSDKEWKVRGLLTQTL